MIRKSLLITAVLAILLVVSLSGCDDDKSKIGGSGDEISSGNSKTMFKNLQGTFGNGTDIVNYKGKLYYIEFKNADFTEEAIGTFDYFPIENTNNQRYVNVIDEKGNIKQLFKVTGANAMTIVNDRFYLKSNSGMLYTVDMHGENSIDLTKGDYLAFDEEGHAVYYQNTSNPDTLFKIDTQTLSISNDEFDNPLKTSGYNFLGVRNNNFYYSYLDKINSKLILMEHSIEENIQKEVANLHIVLHEKDYNNLVSDYVVGTYSAGRFTGLCIGTPNDGSMGGFYDEEFYIFDLEDKTIEKAAKGIKKGETEWFTEDAIEKQLIREVYKLANASTSVPEVNELFTEKDREKFAQKYNIDLEEKLGIEAKEKLATDPEMEKYIIELEDYSIVGNNVFYKITASRRNPLKEIGWRPAFVRMCSEVYVKNLSTEQTLFVYAYVNTNYGYVENEIMASLSGDASGDVSGDISGDRSGDFSGEALLVASGEKSGEVEKTNTNQEDVLGPNETYIDIDFKNLWKQEFDVRVEEVGGMIIGKRIEYEGHHTLDEEKIKIKVTVEPGAKLTVYIDGEESSSYIFDT